MARHILIIDDSRLARVMAARVLTAAGLRVSEADSGPAGLAHLQAHGAPDAVLVDANMPEMDGVDFIRAVRADAAYRALPLVILSGDDGPEPRAQAQAAGATGYLVKPLEVDQLLALLPAPG